MFGKSLVRDELFVYFSGHMKAQGVGVYKVLGCSLCIRVQHSASKQLLMRDLMYNWH